MQITYSKLQKTGAWGIRVETEDPFDELSKPGDDVTVVKRDGEETARRLGSQVWSGESREGNPVGIYEILS